MNQRNSRPVRMPRIYDGQRRFLLWRLVMNGVAQAICAFAVAVILRRSLGAQESPPPEFAAFGLASLGLLLFALRALEATDAERLGQDYVRRVRLRIFASIAARPWKREGRHGLAMTRLISDLGGLRNWVSQGLARSIVSSIVLVGLLLALACFAPVAAQLAFGLIASYTGIVALTTPRVRARVRESRRLRGRLANNLAEKIVARRTIQAFGRRRSERRLVGRQNRRLSEALVRRVGSAQWLRASPEALMPAALAGLLWRESLATEASTTPSLASELAVGLLFFGMIVAALRDLGRAWDHRLNYEEARRRIGALLHDAGGATTRGRRTLRSPGALEVRLENVSAGPWIDRISLCAEASERILVVSQESAAASALFSLLARHADADSGEILVSGHRLARISTRSLRRHVQLVSPQLPLWRASIRANIAYGSQRRGRGALERVEAIAALCALTDDPELGASGLDFELGERGEGLSPSLRFRIALARAALADPKLLLIDDAICSHDVRARRALQRVADELDATLLISGRREDPPCRYDRIWLLDSAHAEPGGSAMEHARVIR